MSFCEPGEEAREGGTSVKSLWALQSLTGCPLSSCSSPGCPWSHVASTRPAASAWAQATLTVDGVFFTTRKYLLMSAIISALLLLHLPLTAVTAHGRDAECCLSLWVSH